MFRRDGVTLHMTAGLRVVRNANGDVALASERFNGAVEASELPSRLGGGFVFYQSNGLATKVWRADDWTGTLVPLAGLSRHTVELVVGFDRLYLRGIYNDIVALDPATGALMPRGSLPLSAEQGAMVFVDGWRAVVDAEFRGPLATFDAGATWRAVPGLTNVRGIVAEGGDPVIFTEGGRVRVTAEGAAPLAQPQSDEEVVADDEVTPVAPRGPLGLNPLRLAVERGLPDSATTVLVADHGRLARVAVPSGRIVALTEPAALQPEAECQGVRVGDGLGFVCGTSGGPTSILRFIAPYDLQEIWRFEEPRLVASSGNGQLVVRGACGPDAMPPRSVARPLVRSVRAPLVRSLPAPLVPAKAAYVLPKPDDPRHHCLLDGRGAKREIVVKGEAGSERIVALRDGRAAVVVPPRPGAPPTLSLLRGSEVAGVPIVIPDEPELLANIARNGMWLDGMWETDSGALGAWVEAGGRALGIEVALDGKVSLGTLYDHGGDVVFSGPLALGVSAEVGFESVDGGKHWTRFVLPRLPDVVDNRTRGCSAAGCSLRGWVRAGWFEPGTSPASGVAGEGQRFGDLREPSEVPARVVTMDVRPSLELVCGLRPTTPAAPRQAASVAASADSAARSLGALGVKTPGLAAAPPNTWLPFDDVAAPALGEGQLGAARGSLPQSSVRASVYAWGPKATAWSRGGVWQARFDDRFASEGWVRSTERARAPWLDFDAALEALGGRPQTAYAQWNVVRDPGGRAALISVCRAHLNRCDLISAPEGEAPVLLATGVPMRPPSEFGAVRLGNRWYFLVDLGAPGGLELWRADSQGASKVARIQRANRTRNFLIHAPVLTRRADGSGLGLLVAMPEDKVDRGTNIDWLMYSLDADTGAVGAPIAIDLRSRGAALRRCEPGEDGWLAEVSTLIPTAVTLKGAAAHLDAFEYRLRLESRGSCIDAIAARASRGLSTMPEANWSAPARRRPIPLTVFDSPSGKRIGLDCFAP